MMDIFYAVALPLRRSLFSALFWNCFRSGLKSRLIAVPAVIFVREVRKVSEDFERMIKINAARRGRRLF